MSSFCAVSWAVDPGACVIEMGWQEPHSRPGLISWLRMLLSAVSLLLTTVRREDGHDTQRSRTALRDGRRDRNLKGRSRDLRRSIAYRANECVQSTIAAKIKQPAKESLFHLVRHVHDTAPLHFFAGHVPRLGDMPS